MIRARRSQFPTSADVPAPRAPASPPGRLRASRECPATRARSARESNRSCPKWPHIYDAGNPGAHGARWIPDGPRLWATTNRQSILDRIGLSHVPVLNAGPYFQARSARRSGCQIDLLLRTKQSLYVFEVKFRSKIDSSVITEVRKKVDCLDGVAGLSVRRGLIYQGEVAPEISPHAVRAAVGTVVRGSNRSADNPSTAELLAAREGVYQNSRPAPERTRGARVTGHSNPARLPQLSRFPAASDRPA